MKIQVHLSGYYNKYLKTNINEYFDLPSDNSTILDFLNILGIPESEVGFVLVNGIRFDTNHLLSNGDLVSILPSIIGG